MSIKDWFVSTQRYRISTAICLSLIAVCGPLVETVAQPKLDATNITILKAVLTAFISFFFASHLGLYAWASRSNSNLRLQFSLTRLLACSLLGALLIGANFIEDPYSISRLIEPGMFKKSDPIFFGLPFEVFRIPFGPDRRYIINPLGIALNVAFLFLFIPNILVLKFNPSQATATVPVSAPQNASH